MQVRDISVKKRLLFANFYDGVHSPYACWH